MTLYKDQYLLCGFFSPEFPVLRKVERGRETRGFYKCLGLIVTIRHQVWGPKNTGALEMSVITCCYCSYYMTELQADSRFHVLSV